MPYSSVDELPDTVQKLPDKRKRQWMSVWNSAYARCKDEGKKDCETFAFRNAWGVVHKSFEEEDGLIFATNYVNGEEFIADFEKASAAINDLPDSAFAYVEPGSEKDEGGKTVPRAKRHFPIHDESHVRNALARLNQSPFGDKAKSRVLSAAHRMGIKLDPERWGTKKDEKLERIIKLMGEDAPRGLFYGVVYEPGVPDSHGDFTSEEEIERAAHDFLPSAVMNIHHKDDLSDVQVVESYIAPADFKVNGQLIRKGSWVLVTRVLNEELRKAIVDGEITGYSLEGTATRVESLL